MDFIFFWSGRPFPVILPHELLPWLMRNGAFPKVSCSDLASYWDHIDARSIPVGEVVNDEIKTKCHPLYIWGDDAQYNAQHEKVIVVVLGHVSWPQHLLPSMLLASILHQGKLTWPLNLVDVGKLKRAMKKPNIYIYNIYIYVIYFILVVFPRHHGSPSLQIYMGNIYIYICFFRYCSNVRWVGTYRFVAQSSSHLSEVLSVGFPTLYAFLEPAPGILYRQLTFVIPGALNLHSHRCQKCPAALPSLR